MAEITPHEFTEYVELAGFIDGSPVFALSDGSIHLAGEPEKQIQVHQDGLTCCVLSRGGKEIISGGEDGRIVSTNSVGEMRVLAEMPGKWIDTITSGPNGVVAFSCGKLASVVLADGTIKQFPHQRSVEGLAFAPKGMRLATAHYNGASLHWVTTDAPPVALSWDGAHTGVVFSPDGKFVVTTMQENALHGWKIDSKKQSDDRHMKMTGYPAKVKSTSWSPKGKWLATSGAQAAIVWPFSGKDGPMGKSPKELGTRGNSMVVQVSCHPKSDVIAVGYADGMILAIRIEDGDEAVLRQGGNGEITTLGWDNEGNRLAFGSETGEAGVIALTGEG